jgi:hypothetical protein
MTETRRSLIFLPFAGLCSALFGALLLRHNLVSLLNGLIFGLSLGIYFAVSRHNKAKIAIFVLICALALPVAFICVVVMQVFVIHSAGWDLTPISSLISTRALFVGGFVGSFSVLVSGLSCCGFTNWNWKALSDLFVWSICLGFLAVACVHAFGVSRAMSGPNFPALLVVWEPSIALALAFLLRRVEKASTVP